MGSWAPAASDGGVEAVIEPAERPSQAEMRAAQLVADELLVARLRQGDVSASSEFYDRVEHVVTGALLQVLGPGDRDHEDLAQLALERIVMSVMKGSFHGRCNLATWASVVTSRVAIDALRRRRHERRIFARKSAQEDEEEPAILAPEVGRPDRRVDSSRKLSALRTALSKISPDKAEAVVLLK